MATERFGIFPLPLSEDDGDRPDFRQVPSSDEGNRGYRDRGQFGSFGPSNREQFRDPPDVKHFTGYGASEADIDLGFIRPEIREDPAYDLADYKLRSTDPKIANDDQGGETDVTPSHWEFRRKNQRARGFLTRPHIPTERN